MAIPYSFIAIEGNIGAGKTTLATKISNDFNAKLVLERFEENPFLPGFYKEPGRYAFPVELSFLADRYQQLKEDLKTNDMFGPFVISDYFLQKCLIFSRNNLNEDESFLFNKLFTIINDSLPKPDLIVYLYQDVIQLRKNILGRGRVYELNISEEYLERIQEGYINFLSQQRELKVVILDMKQIDFIGKKEDYDFIIDVLGQQHPVGISRIIGKDI